MVSNPTYRYGILAQRGVIATDPSDTTFFAVEAVFTVNRIVSVVKVVYLGVLGR